MITLRLPRSFTNPFFNNKRMVTAYEDRGTEIDFQTTTGETVRLSTSTSLALFREGVIKPDELLAQRQDGDRAARYREQALF